MASNVNNSRILRRNVRNSKSLGSPMAPNLSRRSSLSPIPKSYKSVTPLHMKSFLSENTEVKTPLKSGWWKKLDDNSREVMDVIENIKELDQSNVENENFLNIETPQSQKKKKYFEDLPESSSNETIDSIILPSTNFFSNKNRIPEKVYGSIVKHLSNEESEEKTVKINARKLFGQSAKQKRKFPVLALSQSPNKANEKTTNLEIKIKPSNIFSHQAAKKRVYQDFMVSDGETSDATKNNSAGSGWDSHGVTRRTLRQTFGENFTPRKSLRTLVMEKSNKRQTEIFDETLQPNANSTELLETEFGNDNLVIDNFIEPSTSRQTEPLNSNKTLVMQEVENGVFNNDVVTTSATTRFTLCDETIQPIADSTKKIDDNHVFEMSIQPETSLHSENMQFNPNLTEIVKDVDIIFEKSHQLKNIETNIKSPNTMNISKNNTNLSETAKDVDTSSKKLHPIENTVPNAYSPKAANDSVNNTDASEIVKDGGIGSEKSHDFENIEPSTHSQNTSNVSENNTQSTEIAKDVGDSFENSNHKNKESYININKAVNISENITNSNEIVKDCDIDSEKSNQSKNIELHTNLPNVTNVSQNNTSPREIVKDVDLSLEESHQLKNIESNTNSPNVTNISENNTDSQNTTIVPEDYDNSTEMEEDVDISLEKSHQLKSIESNTNSPSASFSENNTSLTKIAKTFDDSDKSHLLEPTNREDLIQEYLTRVRLQNLQERLEIKEKVSKRIESQTQLTDVFHFKPPKEYFKSNVVSAKIKEPKVVQAKKKNQFLLPQNVLEDLKYKPPKKYRPKNAPWITDRLYKHIETKLEPKYGIYSHVRAEKVVSMLHDFVKVCRGSRRGGQRVARPSAVDDLKSELARLRVVDTHHSFHVMMQDYLPLDIVQMVVPDAINRIPLPKNGVFNDIPIKN